MVSPTAHVMSKQEFRDWVCEVIRERIPDLVLEPTGELTLRMRIDTPTGAMEGSSHLNRFYDELQRSPHKLDEVMNRLVRSIRSSLNYTLDLEVVIPVIKSADWLQAQPALARSFVWTEPYNSDLTLTYAQYREGLMYGFMEHCALTRDEMLDIAMNNLRRMSPQVKIIGAAGFYTMTAGNMWNSSLMLLDELREHAALELRGSPVMSVPDRDSFHVVDDHFALAVFQLGIATTTDYRRQPYPLCPRLFTWQGNGWERLDPQPHDPSQSIVNTAEVEPAEPDGRGGCILPLDIRDPMTADARTVYRLFLKLSAYLEAAGSEANAKRFGPPTPESRCILARIHPSSDPIIKDTLRLAEFWVRDDSLKTTCATLRVEEVSSGSFH